jgi:hypothetical protein
MSGGEEAKFFGIRHRRKEILSGDLLSVLDKSIPSHQRGAGVKVLPGENNESFRIGKGLLFNRKTDVYVDNIGFFPEVWITAPEGEQAAKNIIQELEHRGFKPRLHRGLPEVLQ